MVGSLSAALSCFLRHEMPMGIRISPKIKSSGRKMSKMIPTYGLEDPPCPKASTTQKPIRVKAEAVVSPTPIRLIGLFARKSNGRILPVPVCPDWFMAHSRLDLFFLQGTDVSNNISDLIICEFARIGWHFAPALLCDGDQVIVRHLHYIW